MKEEISAAVLFISKLVRRNANMNEGRVNKFEQRLEELLRDRFSTHWHPKQPWRGQGYRCLRVNEKSRREPTIERAARECGLNYDRLNLPVELTIWVDPDEVCCRFGEHKGSCCTIASFKEGNKENNIESFNFAELDRPNSTPAVIVKSLEVLKERTLNSCNHSSPPSSTQSTPTKKKSFSPSHSGYAFKNHASPGRGYGNGSPGRTGGSIRERRPLDSNYHFHSNHHNHNLHPNGTYSPPFYKTQSWVNLSQTPPPPPPPPSHLPIFSSAGFIYPPTAAPHYTHSHSPASHFTRSPPNMGTTQKFKWNSGSNYLRNDRHQWFGQRALARV